MAWRRWAVTDAEELIRKYKTELRLLRTPQEVSGVPFSESVWRANKGQGTFFEKWLGRPSKSLSSAIDPATGKRSWSPNVYKQEVARVVSKPFSTRVEIPAWRSARGPCRGLCKPPPPKPEDLEHSSECDKGAVDCCDIRCSGLPAWWDDKYKAIQG